MIRRKAQEPVLIVIDDMNAGGTERQVVELLKAYRAEGQRPLVLAVLKDRGQRLAEAMSFASAARVFSYRKSPADFLLPFRLLGFMKEHRVGIVCCFGLLSGFFGLVAGRLAGLPVVNASIRSAPHSLSRKDRISRILMMLADFRIANSHAGLKAFRMEKVRGCTVIHNGIDTERFSYSKAEGISYSCCMVANFTKNKDHGSAVKAFALIRKRLPENRFAFVGRDAGTLEPTEAMAESLGLCGVIDYFTDCSDPAGIIAGSSVGLLLSPDGEGTSNSILEYMAMGLPVVATDCDGNRETIIDGATGFLVHNEPEGIAERLLFLLEDPSRARMIGEAGRVRASDVFAMDVMTRAYEAVFAETHGFPGSRRSYRAGFFAP